MDSWRRGIKGETVGRNGLPAGQAGISTKRREGMNLFVDKAFQPTPRESHLDDECEI